MCGWLQRAATGCLVGFRGCRWFYESFHPLPFHRNCPAAGNYRSSDWSTGRSREGRGWEGYHVSLSSVCLGGHFELQFWFVLWEDLVGILSMDPVGQYLDSYAPNPHPKGTKTERDRSRLILIRSGYHNGVSFTVQKHSGIDQARSKRTGLCEYPKNVWADGLSGPGVVSPRAHSLHSVVAPLRSRAEAPTAPGRETVR